MSKLKTLLETLEELDKKRTEGRWYKRDVNRIATTSGHTQLPGSSWQIAETICDPENDTAFIVATANAIPQLLKIIRVQREALEKITCGEDHSISECMGDIECEFASNALSQCEEICGEE